LRNTLFIVFFIISTAVLVISLFLAKIISRPISILTEHMSAYRLGEKQLPETIQTTSYEIKALSEKFKELVERSNDAFAFQKHSTHHISHQLKTPLAVLVSELERIKNDIESEKIKQELEKQISKMKSLADIINVLLEISKIEAGHAISRTQVRVDEIIFDSIEELNTLHPDFNFEVNYFPDEIDANKLVLNVNEMLIRQAFQNLLNNCISYSNNSKAEIKIDCSEKHELKVSIVNGGTTLSSQEEKYLFNHFFRGENSQGKIGFGLGLVLTKKIIALNSGDITYVSPSNNLNTFEVRLPLR
jgi:K+-sensing histidine kinase KdpD